MAAVLQLALFFYIGRIVEPASGPGASELARGYFPFVVIGLVMLAIVHTGLRSFAGRLREEQTTGTFEVLMATPTPPSVIVLSGAAYDLIRATVTGLVTIAAAIAIFGLRLTDDPLALLVALAGLIASIALFSALGVLLAAFTVVFKQGAGAVAFVTTGLALLGGAYFPTEVLPGTLQAIGEAVPFTWALDVMREALVFGRLDGTRLLTLTVSAVVLLPAALAVFRGALLRARASGSLAQY